MTLEIRHSERSEESRVNRRDPSLRFAALRMTALIGFVFILARPAFAGDAPFFKGDVQSKPVEHGLPKAVKNVGFDQKLGDQVTLNLPVRDENGVATMLGAYFGKRPVIL